MARKLRYTVCDTARKVYLARMTLPLGDEGASVTEWTKRPEKAQTYRGKKSAEAMVRKLGSYSEFVVKNGKGEIIA